MCSPFFKFQIEIKEVSNSPQSSCIRESFSVWEDHVLLLLFYYFFWVIGGKLGFDWRVKFLLDLIPLKGFDRSSENWWVTCGKSFSEKVYLNSFLCHIYVRWYIFMTKIETFLINEFGFLLISLVFFYKGIYFLIYSCLLWSRIRKSDEYFYFTISFFLYDYDVMWMLFFEFIFHNFCLDPIKGTFFYMGIKKNSKTLFFFFMF